MTIAEIFTGVGAICTGGWWGWTKILLPHIKKKKKEKEEYRKKLDDILMTLKETTERIENRLDSIEENQKISMNLQGLCYWISDDAGRFTFASPNLCKLTGRSESELMDYNWLQIIIPDDRRRISDAWDFSVDNQTSFDEIFTIRRSDGRLQKVWAVAFPKIAQEKFGGTLGKLTPIEEPN